MEEEDSSVRHLADVAAAAAPTAQRTSIHFNLPIEMVVAYLCSTEHLAPYITNTSAGFLALAINNLPAAFCRHVANSRRRAIRY